jgi:hypothetical protein
MAGKVDRAQDHSEFLASEVDRLVNSARTRIEQQRIHVRELARHGTERAKARHELKLMRAAYRTLRAHQNRWRPDASPSRDARDAMAIKPDEERQT